MASQTFSVTFNTVGSQTVTATDTGDPLITGISSPTDVTTVDQAPTFNGGGNDTTPEDSGPQTMPAWATAIDAGAPNESGQILTFIDLEHEPALSAAASRTSTRSPAT